MTANHDDADLEYAGRNRKRPPGASDLVQRIYILLDEHPEGMTRDDLWSALRDGWLETDAYRAYERHLAQRRGVYHHSQGGGKQTSGRSEVQYGSELFKERAQKWWISEALSGMTYRGSVRRDGPRGHSRFFAKRPPQVVREGKRRYYAPLDVAAQKAASRADTDAHIRREQIKARFLEDLQAKRPSQKRLLETIRLGYEYLSGR